MAALLPAIQVLGSVLHASGPAVASGAPVRASVITGEQLQSWKPRLLTDALARHPGVSLYDDLGSGSKMTLATRGFTASPVVGLPQGVSVFLDGVPVNEPDAGQVNFDLLPLDHVERVEFLGGTASLLGPHSLGGAVNLMTRHGQDDPRGQVQLSAGSHHAYSGTVSYGGRAGRGWSYYAGGGYSGEAGWRQLTDAMQLHALLNAGRLGRESGFRMQALLARGNASTAGSLPLSVFRSRPDSNLSAGDFESLNQVHLALSAYRRVGNGRSTSVFYLRQHDAERFNVNQVDDPDVRSFSNNRSLGGNLDWSTAFGLGGGTLDVRVGGGGSANRTRVQIYAERIDAGLTTDVQSPIAKIDAYSIANFMIRRATVSAGARYDLVRVPFRNRIDPTRDTTSVFQRLSPRASVTVGVGDAGSLYASLGESFRAPAVIELACADPHEPCPLPFALGDDPPLDPVIARTFEVGGRWSVAAAELSASAYRTAVRDDVFLFPYDGANAPSGSTIDGFFANIASTRREGVELSSRASVGLLELHGSYAWTRATFQVEGIEIFSIREEAGGKNEVERGDRLPLIPAHTASLAASASFARGISLGTEWRYTGARVLRGDEANEEAPLAGYWLADVTLGVERDGWEIRTIVRNVFAADHATFGTFNFNQGAGDTLERFLTPGAPRRFQLVVRRRIQA